MQEGAPALSSSPGPLPAGRANYRLVVEYDGTAFRGFQRQRDLRTVGGELEAALAGLFEERVVVAAAGRTDAGVHASGQVISFVSHDRFPLHKLVIAANSRLAEDLSVRDAARVPDRFSARFHALERRYTYVVLARREPSAVLRRMTHFDYRPLDLGAMREAASRLEGERDFASFCATPPEKGGTVRDLRRLAIERDGDLLRFEFAANGFLHRMVRIAVGTILAVGAGSLAPDDLTAILARHDRRAAGPTAPARALTLTDVCYDGFTSRRSG